MRAHHLNCVSACPLGGALMDGFSRGRARGRLATHCLLLEHSEGLVLVDTGYGLRDVADPHGRLSELFLWLCGPELRVEMTAVRQIQALGFHAHDVRHIVLSHLDFDHAGGLDDFPMATVHLSGAELGAATTRAGLVDRMRYRPQQWSSRERWRALSQLGGERWKGFASVQEIPGLGADVLMVPLMGHTLGHAGIAIRSSEGQREWLFYVGDAYFHHREMDVEHPSCPPGLRLYQAMMDTDRSARRENQGLLRALVRDYGPSITVFCAHDVDEMEQLSGRSHERPIEPPPPPAPADPSTVNPGDPGPPILHPSRPTPIDEDPRIPHELPPAIGE